MTDHPDDAALREELVSSEPGFDGRLLHVRVDHVRLADGTPARREVVQHPGAVAILPMLDDRRVVLLRQFRQPAGEVLWEVPAGTLHPGEAPADCARRELIEEIGYAAGSLEPLTSMYVAPGYTSEIIHLFVARDLRPAPPNLDHDERLHPVVLDLDQVHAMIATSEIRDAKTICAVLLAAEARRR